MWTDARRAQGVRALGTRLAPEDAALPEHVHAAFSEHAGVRIPESAASQTRFDLAPTDGAHGIALRFAALMSRLTGLMSLFAASILLFRALKDAEMVKPP